MGVGFQMKTARARELNGVHSVQGASTQRRERVRARKRVVRGSHSIREFRQGDDERVKKTKTKMKKAGERYREDRRKKKRGSPA